MLIAGLVAIVAACTGADPGSEPTAGPTASAAEPSQGVPPTTPANQPERVNLRGAVVAQQAGCVELQTSGGRYALLGVSDPLLPGAIVAVRGRALHTVRAPCAGTPFRVTVVRQVGVQAPSPQPPPV